MTLRLHRRTCAALAIAAYLVVALVACRNVLSSPATLLPYPATLNDATRLRMAFLDHWDQAMVIATVVRNADLLVSRPWDLLADVGELGHPGVERLMPERVLGDAGRGDRHEASIADPASRDRAQAASAHP